MPLFAVHHQRTSERHRQACMQACRNRSSGSQLFPPLAHPHQRRTAPAHRHRLTKLSRTEEIGFDPHADHTAEVFSASRSSPGCLACLGLELRLQLSAPPDSIRLCREVKDGMYHKGRNIQGSSFVIVPPATAPLHNQLKPFLLQLAHSCQNDAANK
jgi:hypothetical protein